MELAMTTKADFSQSYPIYVIGAGLMGAGAGLIASHLVSSIAPIKPLVSAVYGSVACATSALLQPVLKQVIENNNLGKILKIALDILISFSIAFLVTSLYGFKLVLPTAALVAGIISTINMMYVFTIRAGAAARAA